MKCGLQPGEAADRGAGGRRCQGEHRTTSAALGCGRWPKSNYETLSVTV